ncbi:glycosyltransferase family 4 protein [Nocardioides korecus]
MPDPAAPRSVVLVSGVFPHPRDSGKKVMVAGLLDYWRRRVGADQVHLVLVGGGEVDLDQVDAVVHRVDRPGARTQLRSVLVRSVLTRGHTLQESALYSASVRRRLADLLGEISADLEVFDTVRMGQYAEEIPVRPGARRVIFLDDLFSVRYERMLALMREHPEVDFDPLGDFRANLPAAVGPVADRRVVRRALLAWERAVVARREQAMAELFETVMLVSPEETRRLAGRVPSARVRELRPVLDLAAPERPPLSGPPVFVLLGLLTLAHNADGVESFLERGMSGLLTAVPDAIVHVVGRGATPRIEAAAAPWGDAVRLEGFVDDLDGLLNRATALLMPLRFGSGIKIKVIEALARGLPVVSTPIGAEGVETGADRGILLVPDASAVGEVVRDLRDPARHLQLSGAARRHYEERYSLRAAFATYDEAFAARA